MSAKEKIIKALKSAVEELTGADTWINLEISHDLSYGDYSTNAAMAAFNASKFKSPLELAEKIADKLKTQSSKLENLDRIETAPPGFINFWLSDEYLFSQLKEVISKKDNFSKNKKLDGKKIVVEFGDPNPFKELHIGHLRNLILGESLSRLLENQGAEVFRVNYQGDVGLHVAKAIYGIQSLNKKSTEDKSRFLGRAYAYGAKAYEEDEKAKKEIESINIKIYKNDSSVKALWQKGRQWSLDYFDGIYKRLGVKYKYYYFESITAPLGRKIVLEHIKDRIFEPSQGAVVFRGDDHTRVFLTTQDYATYEAKDLALAYLKYQNVPYDRSIILTASEQSSYFSVILAAMEKVLPELAKKTKHYAFGFVSLKEGKMSSRKGNIIAADWLLNEVSKRMKDSFPDMDEDTLEKVAIGAVKYSMLKFSRASDITFSLEESISLEGNSGPYLQYTFARTQSVLAKAKSEKLKVKSENKNSKLEAEEFLLLRLLIHFPEIVKESSENIAPNILCNYLFELAQAFNNFYQKVPILNPEPSIGENLKRVNDAAPLDIDKIREFRLTLTSSIGLIIKNGLELLGIEAPDKM